MYIYVCLSIHPSITYLYHTCKKNYKKNKRCVRSLIFSIISCLEILHMVNMPVDEFTLTILILKLLLQSKDSLLDTQS